MAQQSTSTHVLPADKSRSYFVCKDCSKLYCKNGAILKNEETQYDMTNYQYSNECKYKTQNVSKTQYNKLDIHMTNEHEYKQTTIKKTAEKIDDKVIEWYQTKYGSKTETKQNDTYSIQNIAKKLFTQLRQQHWDYVDHKFNQSQQTLNKLYSENNVLKHQINVINNETEYMVHKLNDNFNLSQRYLNQICDEHFTLKQRMNVIKEQTNCMEYKLLFVIATFIAIISICLFGMFHYINSDMNNRFVQMEQKLYESIQVNELQYNEYGNDINLLNVEIALMNDTNKNSLRLHEKLISDLEVQIQEENKNIATLQNIHEREIETLMLKVEENWFNDLYFLVVISTVTVIFIFFTIKQKRQCIKDNHILIDDNLNKNDYIKATQNLINNTNNTKAKTVPSSQESQKSSNNNSQNYNNKEGDTPQENNNNNDNTGGNNNNGNNGTNSGSGGDGGKHPKKNIKQHDNKIKKKKRKKKQKKRKQGEHNIELMASKSAPNPTTTTLNANATVFWPTNSPPLTTNTKKEKYLYAYNCLTIPEKQKGELESSRKRKNKGKNAKKKKNNKRKRNKLIHNSSNETRYEPKDTLRGQGKILVTKEMKDIISSTIKEKYFNLNHFMDRVTAITHGLQQSSFNTENGDNIKILNYDFHDKNTNEIVYCVVKKDEIAIERNFEWNVIALMKASDIMDKYGINSLDLAESFRDKDIFSMDKIAVEKNKVKTVISDSIKMFSIINDAEWTNSSIVQVFGKFGKKYGKRSMTLSIEKTEFMAKLNTFVTDTDTIELIPILVFKDDNYWVEYVWIISVDNGTTNVGISFKCEENNNDVNVTGIHCDKDCLLEQHQLISCGIEGQEYGFWNNFTSNITYLNVCGNPSPKLYRNKFQKSKDFIKKWVNMDSIDVGSFRKNGKEFIKNIN